MKLSEYLTPDRIAILSGKTKQEALGELIDVLSAHGRIDRDELGRAVWQREEMMSTGIGHGLAIPHVRMAQLGAATMGIGVAPNGIADYKSLDDKPVRIVVLIAAPQGQHETYIRLLAKVTDVLRHERLRQKVIDAQGPDDIYDVFTAAED